MHGKYNVYFRPLRKVWSKRKGIYEVLHVRVDIVYGGHRLGTKLRVEFWYV